MGSKIESKKLMAAAGVPVLDELDPATVTADDLPVLIKASAGGGGRGMRIVRDLAELPHEVEAARAEAAGAFGDPTVFCEPYLATGRHIEVQVMADPHGTVWAVGERECSIQRRHQKVVEEAPSPLVERLAGCARQLFDAARAAARAIGYTGAGTVEFLADDDGRFFFLEMNTRLQVEHPVTECTTGLDLVALQLAVAAAACPRPGAAASRTATRSRSASMPRIRRPAGSRSAAPCTASRSRASRRVRPPRRRGRAPARQRRRGRLGGRDPLRPDAREGHRLGPDPRRRPPPRWPRPSPAPGSTASSPTATCW